MNFQQDLNKKLNEIGGTGVGSIIPKLIEMTKSFGGKIYLVGGAVRDEMLGKESKDYDFMITKITLDDLAKRLQQVLPGAKVNEVGQSFGVVKMSYGNDEYDFAIPRADVDRQNVKTDPNIPVEQDLLRRDFTINAMAKDLETGEIVNAEGQNGQQDLKDGIIRAVGNPQARFQEDPLRMLRALQFASRFGFDIEPHTLQAIKENVDLLTGVSGERFYEEFNKAWTKGNSDTQKFFRLLQETNIGRVMFGEDFTPVALDMSSLHGHEGFLIQAIAAFLGGGNYEKLILKTDEQDLIRVARWFRMRSAEAIDYESIKTIAKFGQHFPLILKSFGMIDQKTRGTLYPHMKKLISKPLIPKIQSGKQESWELPVGGGELIELAKEIGVDLKGKAIGETALKLIKAYQNDLLTVSDNNDENKEIIKNALKKILAENYIKESSRLEILKNRMDNILYK